MCAKGVQIACNKFGFGYIGDYYCLSSKRSAFYYVAISKVSALALTKKFMFDNIFKKFPGV